MKKFNNQGVAAKVSDFWREILFYLGIMATYVVTWSLLWGIVIFFGSRTH